MGGLGSGEWMPTTSLAAAADAAVLVYLSILEAPRMGGLGEAEREGWAGYDLRSGCRQVSSQLLRTQLFSSIFQFWRPLEWEGEWEREGCVGWDLGSECRQLSAQLLQTQLFSSIFRFWKTLGWEGEGKGRRKEGWAGWDLGSGCRQLSTQLLRTQLFLSIFQFRRPLGYEGAGRGRGKDGQVGICAVDADSCCGCSCSRLSFNFGDPWDGRERGEGEGRMGGLGAGEWALLDALIVPLPLRPCPKLLLVLLLIVLVVILVVGMLAARLRRATARLNRKYDALGDRLHCHEIETITISI